VFAAMLLTEKIFAGGQGFVECSNKGIIWIFGCYPDKLTLSPECRIVDICPPLGLSVLHHRLAFERCLEFADGTRVH
jgi:hypothetical protein